MKSLHSRWSALALGAFLAVGCGDAGPDEDFSGEDAAQESKGGTNAGKTSGKNRGNEQGSLDEATVDGMPAEAYFEQFLYQEAEGSTLETYRYLVNMDSVFLKDTPDLGTFATIRLALREDRTFVLEYTEWVKIRLIDGGAMETRDVANERRTGKWSIDGTELVVGNLGRGRGIQTNGSDGVLFSLQQALASPEGKNNAFNLRYVYSSAKLE